MRKKILYVITKSVWGGAQRYVYDLATHLPRGKFEVAVVCGGQGPLIEKLNQAGIRAISLPMLERDVGFFKEILSLWSLIKIFIREKPDIVHLSSSKAGGLGAASAFIYKILYPKPYPLPPRILFTVHGWGFDEDRPRWQRAIIFFFSWLSTVFQDKVILIDSADYRTAERFIPRKKLTLVRHGIAPIDFWPKDEARKFLAAKTGRNIPPEAIIIGTIAELTKNKGLTYLLDASKQAECQMSNVKCQMVIIGDGEERKNLQKQIQTLGLENTAHLVGFIPDASRYLKGFDLFVLPSVKEGLPYVLMEAMAAGLPIVASNVGGVPDLIKNRKSGILVPPKDIGALVNAIAELLQDPAKRQTLAEASREKIENEFGLDAMIENTIKVYTAS